MIQIYKAGNTKYDWNGDAVLHPTRCALEMNLKGTWDLELKCPMDEHISLATINAVISAPTPMGEGQLFRIYGSEKNDNGVSAKARPIFFDAVHDSILMDVRPTKCTGSKAAEKISTGKYDVKSNITAVNTAYYVRKNLIEAIQGSDDNSFLNRWGGEPVYDNYTCIINKRAGGDYGARASFGHNLKSIEEHVNCDNVVTRIIPESYNGHTLPGETPWVDSPNINKYPIVYTKVIRYDDVKLQEDCAADEAGCADLNALYDALRARAKEDFASGIDLPETSYEVEIIDLEDTVEFDTVKDLVKIGLGDTVKAEHAGLGITTTVRAVKVVWDCIRQKNESVSLGDPEVNYFDNLTSTMRAAEMALNRNGTVKGEQVAGLISLMTTRLRASASAATPQADKAILFEDLDPKSESFGAMAIGTTGFMIAGNRTADGRDWDWRTFGTGLGFIADYLIAGVLMSRNYKDGEQGFKLDLDSGKIFASLLQIYGRENGKKFSVSFQNGNIALKNADEKTIVTINLLQNVDLATGQSSYSGIFGSGNTFMEVDPTKKLIRLNADTICAGYDAEGKSGKAEFSDGTYLTFRKGLLVGGKTSEGGAF